MSLPAALLSRVPFSLSHDEPGTPASDSDTESITTTSSSASSSLSPSRLLDRLVHHVCARADILKPALLGAVFDMHCGDDAALLTLCINEQKAADLSHQTIVRLAPSEWQAKQLDGVDYRFASADGCVSLSHTKAAISTDPLQASRLNTFAVAGLRCVLSAVSESGHESVYILERPRVVFPPLSSAPSYSPCAKKPETGNIPTLGEWQNLWRAWDLVTLGMIPQEMLLQKPIDLRHKCLFYIGHIPTFLDMLLSKSIGGSPTEPAYFWDIFERGIDPHVDDPDHCHNHSVVPEKDEDWPSLDGIIGFRNGVRARLAQLYDDIDSGKRTLTRNIARTLVMTLEHEGWHVETLLYMLIQRAGTGTLPPPGFTEPAWDLLKLQWDATPKPCADSVVVGPAMVTMGHDDSEADDAVAALKFDAEEREYGWDNESPPRQVRVESFRASWRPITNNEFFEFWAAGKAELPQSWVEEDGQIKVRTVYGLVPMDVAGEWPVLTTYDDLKAYARSKGGRLPTEPELRLFLDTHDSGFEGGGNVGFRNWHPVPATAGIDGAKGTNGGVWEWTSTVFDTHEGLAPTNLFTGYSTDFFDTKHQSVLGASYATIPRLGRRTVRNFWQRGYGYAWVGARIVWDV
ncbi:unnamed protein product [Mycena citricolor]|uniref:Sulfatase-modifying factor enzyme domain-containing protein n=1 Tax=Mycena citricolor TaxID=2018698 RepID=A0AAD2JWD9_9AGAR|nr:unnamed protein product [Mycena citricolor]